MEFAFVRNLYAKGPEPGQLSYETSHWLGDCVYEFNVRVLVSALEVDHSKETVLRDRLASTQYQLKLLTEYCQLEGRSPPLPERNPHARSSYYEAMYYWLPGVRLHALQRIVADLGLAPKLKLEHVQRLWV